MTRVFSDVQVQRLVVSRWLAYIDYVQDISRDGPIVDSGPIVRELADVFPFYLLGLPSERYIHFSIDLEPGTHPISILLIIWP